MQYLRHEGQLNHRQRTQSNEFRILHFTINKCSERQNFTAVLLTDIHFCQRTLTKQVLLQRVRAIQVHMVLLKNILQKLGSFS